MSADVKALIDHYAQVGQYQHIQTVCDEVIKKRGNDAVLVFWRAFGAAMEGEHLHDCCNSCFLYWRCLTEQANLSHYNNLTAPSRTTH